MKPPIMPVDKDNPIIRAMLDLPSKFNMDPEEFQRECEEIVIIIGDMTQTPTHEVEIMKTVFQGIGLTETQLKVMAQFHRVFMDYMTDPLIFTGRYWKLKYEQELRKNAKE